jgi:hypothetical protein
LICQFAKLRTVIFSEKPPAKQLNQFKRLSAMNKTALLLALVLSVNSFAQSDQTIATFDQRQQELNNRGMIVLGSWAATSITTGIIARSQTTGTAHYFHEMNALWNSVNFTLAGISLLQSRKEQPFGLDYSLKRQRKLETVFLINSGLDLGYIGTGFYLRHAADSKADTKAQRLEGYGNSLLLQGGFLLCFDGAMYLIHKHHGKQLLPAKNQLNVRCSPFGITLRYQF